MKKITIKADTTLKYLQLWNGIFNLTDMELEVLAVLVDSSDSLDDVCNVSVKKTAASILKIEDYRTLNNYVKRLKDKGAINLDKKSYKVNSILNPKTNDVHINIQHD
tara:strand:- start:10720 stop:11040 length:321 start_codon:yes stop_codon:yes gene_type:complete